MSCSILVLNGPNLNLLGAREPSVYGHKTLDQINASIVAKANELFCNVEFVQSNHEGELIDAIQASRERNHGMILNAGAFTHTSIALRDAILATKIPFVEVHLSNVAARESFRRRSYFSDIAIGVVHGFGWFSYLIALEALVHSLNSDI